VLSFGGIFNIGEKLFAVPWSVLKLDTVNERFVLDVAKERFKNAPGFESGAWPDMTNQAWSDDVRSYYNTSVY
jgi:hypothetical protein